MSCVHKHRQLHIPCLTHQQNSERHQTTSRTDILSAQSKCDDERHTLLHRFSCKIRQSDIVWPCKTAPCSMSQNWRWWKMDLVTDCGAIRLSRAEDEWKGWSPSLCSCQGWFYCLTSLVLYRQHHGLWLKVQDCVDFVYCFNAKDQVNKHQHRSCR